MPRTKKNAEAQVAKNAAKEAVQAAVQEPEAPAKEAREIAYVNSIPKGYVQEQKNGKGARVGITVPMDENQMKDALAKQAETLERAKANPEAGIKVPMVSQPTMTAYVNSTKDQVVPSKYNEGAVNIRGYELPVKAPGEDRKVLDADGIKNLNEQHKAAIAQHKEFLAEPNAAARDYNQENAKNIQAAADKAAAIAKAQEAAAKAAPEAQASKEAEGPEVE